MGQHMHVQQMCRVVESNSCMNLDLLCQHNLFCDNCHSHVARALNLMWLLEYVQTSHHINFHLLSFWTQCSPICVYSLICSTVLCIIVPVRKLYYCAANPLQSLVKILIKNYI